VIGEQYLAATDFHRYEMLFSDKGCQIIHPIGFAEEIVSDRLLPQCLQLTVVDKGIS
jgi:hypothetical protein